MDRRFMGLASFVLMAASACATPIVQYRVGFDRWGIYRYEDVQKMDARASNALALARHDPGAACSAIERFVAEHPDDLAALKIYVDCAAASGRLRRAYDVLCELRLRRNSVGPDYGLGLIAFQIDSDVPTKFNVRDFPLLARETSVIVQSAFRRSYGIFPPQILWSDLQMDLPQTRDYWREQARTYGKKDPKRILMYAAFLNVPKPISMIIQPLPNGKNRQAPGPAYADFRPDFAEAIRQAKLALAAGVKAPIAFYIIGYAQAYLGDITEAKRSFGRYLASADSRDPRIAPARRYLVEGTPKSMDMPMDWKYRYYF